MTKKNNVLRTLPTKPDMKKVRAKILNTQKHAETHPKCVHAAANLSRLQAKYPNAIEASAAEA